MATQYKFRANSLLINTGNILTLNDITKKTAQNPTEELNEAIIATVSRFKQPDVESIHTENQIVNHVVVYRADDDALSKINEYDSSDLKFGLKLFLITGDALSVKAAIKEAFNTLKTSQIQNVIICLKQKVSSPEDIHHLKSMWLALEELITCGAVQQLGIADIEEAAFREMYTWANVKPQIIQINLATCCVVPPTLQSFCKTHDIQLLTHSDSCDILPQNDIERTFGQAFRLNWVIRFLVHVKCRGLLITKGYLVSFTNLINVNGL